MPHDYTEDQLVERPAIQLFAELDWQNPAANLSPDSLTAVTRQMLEQLKSLLVLDWRQRVGARASVREAIKKELDEGLPRVYTPELYQNKVSAVFEHFFESYYG